jgi:Kef-type K+ transport system membrane component KefB
MSLPAQELLDWSRREGRQNHRRGNRRSLYHGSRRPPLEAAKAAAECHRCILLISSVALSDLAVNGAVQDTTRVFGYAPAARSTMWALTLPRAAATLAAAVVAFDTRDGLGQRMLDGTMLNAVLVLMLATSILGPVLTERFAPRMLEETIAVRGTS